VQFIERLTQAGYSKTAYDERKWPSDEDLADNELDGEPMYDDQPDDEGDQ